MHYFKVTMAYKGTAYYGWQTQSAEILHEKKPTIEGTLLNALAVITKYQVSKVSCASRTDGGVHAQGQIAKISLPISISADHLLLGLNSLLPKDIRILSCNPSTKEYQPNRQSVSKEYHYYFTVGTVENAVLSDISHHHLRPQGVLDLGLLREACQLFIGYHDFQCFSSRDKNITSTLRTIFDCDILQANFSPLAGSVYYLRVVGDGFLKHMVRYLMGALLALDKQRISLTDISVALSGVEAVCKLSPKAKPKGLHLMHVHG